MKLSQSAIPAPVRVLCIIHTYRPPRWLLRQPCCRSEECSRNIQQGFHRVNDILEKFNFGKGIDDGEAEGTGIPGACFVYRVLDVADKRFEGVSGGGKILREWTSATERKFAGV